MADATTLRSNQINRQASVATPPSHGSVQTGALPNVQVKKVPVAPQMQPSQAEPQKRVEILPPRDAESALRTGGLPMVAVKMTAQGPQPDNGQEDPVVILASKDQRNSVSAGGLPMVRVNPPPVGPQIETAPTAQDGPPRIQAPMPALSQPRVPQGHAPTRGGGFRLGSPTSSIARGVPRTVAAPQQQVAQLPQAVAVAAAPQVPLPEVPELTTDQLMLCRHVVDKHLAELVAAVPEGTDAEPGSEASTVIATIAIAKSTIATIDDTLVAVAVRAEAAAKAAEAAAMAAAEAAAAPPAPSVVPMAPSVAYNAGRVAGQYARPVGAGPQARPVGAQSYVAGRTAQRNAGMAPRRVARDGSPPPPVIVKMDGGRPVVQSPSSEGGLPPVIVKMDGGHPMVQNKAEVAEVRAAVAAAKTAHTVFSPAEVHAEIVTEPPQE